MSDWDYECAIIGGGPGGLVSALYMGRFQRSTVLINAGKPRAAWIPRSHNMMAFPNGISGKRILARLNRQVTDVGVHKLRGEARIDPIRGRGFEVSVGKDRFRAKKVILATGIEDVQPDIPNLNVLRECGRLRYCPICDAYEYRGKSVGVLIDDKEGLDKALFLGRFTRKLHVFIPEDLQIIGKKARELRAAGAAVHRGALEAIEWAENPTGVWVCQRGRRPIYCKVVYPALGSRVHDSAFGHLSALRRTQQGQLITTTEQRCAIPGLFAVGDCVNLLAQVSVAAGQAAVAAVTAHNDLLDEKGERWGVVAEAA